MERLTKKENEEWSTEADVAQLTERLARFEEMVDFLAARQRDMIAEMEQLRGQGKDKTVQFRELMGGKLMNANMLQTLKMFGIEGE